MMPVEKFPEFFTQAESSWGYLFAEIFKRHKPGRNRSLQDPHGPPDPKAIFFRL